MVATPAKKPIGFNSSTSGALPLNNAIDLVKGTTATKLTCPSGYSTLVVKAEVDTFGILNGDRVADWPAEPSATTTGSTAGNALWNIPTTDKPYPILVGGGKSVTVKGPNAGSILKYYWL